MGHQEFEDGRYAEEEGNWRGKRAESSGEGKVMMRHLDLDECQA